MLCLLMSSCSLLLPATPACRCRGRYFPTICLAIGLTIASHCPSATEALSWFATERPRLAAQQAVDLLDKAAVDGLDAQDYNAEGLQKAIENAISGMAMAEDQVTRIDLALTSAMRRYLTDLHFGRIDPHQLGANYRQAVRAFDADLFLSSAITDDRLAEAVRSMAPALPQYGSLQAALAHYRELTGHPAWQQDLPPLPNGQLKPGEKYAGIPALLQRLELLGDLRAGIAPPGRYEGAIVEGVRIFQERHGMVPSGVLGKDAFALLNVPPASRARQLELALERLRWTPLLPAPRVVVVNVPEFMLRAYQVRDGRIEMKTAMKVIVGTARKTPTPLFDAEMRFVEFSPYWNVPPSIARSETLPRLRRDPGYFDRQGFEFVGSDGRVIVGLDSTSLDAVQRGQMRIRQKPGAGNALGDIKFVFPNKDNIYLHHTPTPQLFKRDRRDFSHGCIRIEAPVELAKFVLADAPEWSEARIVQAMRKGKSMTIRLPESLPVVIAYQTAAVRDGRVYFFPDIYRQDPLLDAALRQHSLAVQASHPANIPAESTH
ncbi:L,D-transpeptidase family protein [Candidatus Accumulibacter vicinus]|uniref:Murein L,D-transpeptidase n=1 Tax=Candidatus Accumulibacter vicinus TaxID=2954382 RepID=A0A084XYV5_9PROT|nr:L,D-transpeptidase family protein [Candidatus Accumulibacter vicinus]KFB67649.1 MAG: murein L,D-transpeptidase [Candidatus Accumulibacter vicinus]